MYETRSFLMESGALSDTGSPEASSDFGFAFNDVNFSDRILRIEILPDSPGSKIDPDDSLADWARNRKRRRDDQRPKTSSSSQHRPRTADEEEERRRRHEARRKRRDEEAGASKERVDEPRREERKKRSEEKRSSRRPEPVTPPLDKGKGRSSEVPRSSEKARRHQKAREPPVTPPEVESSDPPLLSSRG